jgi:transcription elongation factor Elf1
MLESKYVSLLSPRLRNFKRKSANLWNFSCPLCGDSKVKTTRARGYIYQRDGKYLFHCHNCGITLLFKNLLKTLDTQLYLELMMENLRSRPDNNNDDEWKTETSPELIFSDARHELLKLPSIAQLDDDHPAKIYINGRMIPKQHHSLLRYCPNFMTWTNNLIPKFSERSLRHDEGRVLLPYLTKDQKFFAFTGRSMTNNERHGVDTKYLHITLNSLIPRIFGMDRVDMTKTIFVFEGEFDSLFIPNSIAVGGQNISLLTSVTDIDKYILCFDNEPHSENTKKKIISAIYQGFKVCIWPQFIQAKDVNEMVKTISPDIIKDIIEKHYHTGLHAQNALQHWSKK